MPENNELHVFVSHYHEDETNIQGMKNLLGANYCVKNSSVTSDKFNRASNPEYIKRLLRLRIHWAGQFICLIGPHTHESEWVDYEIRQAYKKGKPIIGVYINGASDADVPEALKEYADAIVGWRRESIINALNSTEASFENVDGSAWTKVSSTRTTC